jgi:hypothetical protein
LAGPQEPHAGDRQGQHGEQEGNPQDVGGGLLGVSPVAVFVEQAGAGEGSDGDCDEGDDDGGGAADGHGVLFGVDALIWS